MSVQVEVRKGKQGITRRASVVALLAGLLLIAMGAATSAQAVSRYGDCAALRVNYPTGVASTVQAATAAASTGFERPAVNRAIYNANVKLDQPRNGVVCEVVKAKPPSEPQNVRTTSSTTTTVILQWEPPAKDGGAPVTSYAISGGGTATISGTSATITGLVAGTSYSFRVTAINGAGVGSPTTLAVTTVMAPAPAATQAPPAPAPAGGSGPTALCKDGTLSYSATHSGTCSSHGGVSAFYR